MGRSPAITFTAYYSKLWDQRPAAPAVTSTGVGYQLQPTPPEYLNATETLMSGRFIEDLSALSDETKDQSGVLDRSWTGSVQHPGCCPVLTTRR